MSNRIAIYPGSFDPPTNGHLDLIHRAHTMFSKLIVAVARNNEKSCLFNVEERIDMLRAITPDLPDIEVTSFSGLTAQFARERGAVALVRGLRVVSDFEFEITMAINNRKLNPDIDTVCLMPSEKYLLLSSRLVREVAQYGGDLSDYVPPIVAERLLNKLGRS
ncbi:MAG TPA: pantetheine-phosphate adenylyltransferase [Candidatus Hydrogenedentes bacterium]|nr:pantetheine-phosphate adenylyltransferase [Candidatus Hydrogenedentota bacterium]HOS02902.1 pantetheine-phosphate adenylyltransferase [Candidatus Hydrogenedentota bacterium]